MIVGGFLLEGSQDIDIVGGSVGPCRAQSFLDAFGSDGTTGPLGNGIQPCYGGLKIDHNGAAPNRITVDGDDFHDFDYSDECANQGRPGYVFPWDPCRHLPLARDICTSTAFGEGCHA